MATPTPTTRPSTCEIAWDDIYPDGSWTEPRSAMLLHLAASCLRDNLLEDAGRDDQPLGATAELLLGTGSFSTGWTRRLVLQAMANIFNGIAVDVAAGMPPATADATVRPLARHAAEHAADFAYDEVSDDTADVLHALSGGTGNPRADADALGDVLSLLSHRWR